MCCVCFVLGNSFNLVIISCLLFFLLCICLLIHTERHEFLTEPFLKSFSESIKNYECFELQSLKLNKIGKSTPKALQNFHLAKNVIEAFCIVFIEIIISKWMVLNKNMWLWKYMIGNFEQCSSMNILFQTLFFALIEITFQWNGS